MESSIDIVASIVYISIAMLVVLATTFVFRRHEGPDLSHYPGPLLARYSKWYRAYYDVVKFGGLLENLSVLHGQYGPVVRIGPNELHFCEPQAYFDIYSFSNLTKEPTLYNSFPFHEASISFTDPRKASTRRDILSPLFSRTSILKFENVVQDKVDKLVTRLNDFAGTKSVVDMHMAFRSATMDIITSYCFATSIDALDHPHFEHPILKGLQTGVTSAWILKYIPWLTTALESAPNWVIDLLPRENQFFRDLRIYSSAQISKYLDDPSALDLADQTTIFHHLLNPKAATVPSRTSLMGEVMALLAAGHDTVGGACTVGAYHVLKNHSVQARLRAELHEAWPDPNAPATYQTLEKLPYLTAVIKESLRLSHGVVSNLPRVAGEALTIAGYNVPPRTVVSMSAIYLHLNCDIFPDPRTFNPDRWLQPDSGKLLRYLVPFSRGSRMCLGVNLAWCELYLLFGYMFRKTNLKIENMVKQDYTTFRDFFVPLWDGNHLQVVVDSTS